jgi:exopolyphosphatase/guanosine-5'-triphosphate,3'-diphosphate pyrophosphatase
MQNGTLLAAIDLGSNSFRLEIGRLPFTATSSGSNTSRRPCARAAAWTNEKNLNLAAMQRGWDCLARFAERLHGFQKHQVRAVATQTLREARNRDVFLARAQQILGFAIEVVSGQEEARLIYQGVSRLLPQSQEKRLVVDIGGRSTEMILGQGYEARRMESYRLGSVAWSTRYFPKGQCNTTAFRMAEIAAQAVLDEAVSTYPDQSVGGGLWVLGHGWCRGRHPDRRRLCPHRGDTSGPGLAGGAHGQGRPAPTALRLDGLKEDRRAVLGGGVAVLRAVFDLLGIEEMQAAQGALRHGVLYDMLDREQGSTDIRSSHRAIA